MSNKVISLASVLHFDMSFLLMVVLIEHKTSPVCRSQQYLVIEKKLNRPNITQAMLNRLVALPPQLFSATLSWFLLVDLNLGNSVFRLRNLATK